jgi:hypothetical protein
MITGFLAGDEPFLRGVHDLGKGGDVGPTYPEHRGGSAVLNVAKADT